MVRRVLLVAGGLAAGLGLLGAAAVVAILASAPGHAVARRLAVSALGRAVDGRVKIGALSGSLWRAAELRDVELAMPDGRPVIRVARIRIRYALADLVRRRFVLSRVELVRPTVVLEAGADGHLNIEHLFRLLEPAPAGARALVELHAVHLTDGTVVLRERPDSSGAVRVRRFLGIDIDASRVLASHPDTIGVVADLRRFAASATDPAVRLVDAAGRVVVTGDSVRFDLSRLRLAGTAGAVRGTVRWGPGAPAGRATLEVVARLREASFGDFRWAAPGLPAQGGGSVTVRASLLAGGGSEWSFRNADLRSGRSQVRGSVDLTVGSRGGVKIGRMDVAVGPLDLAMLAPFLGRMPVAGLARGRVRAAGTLTRLDVNADLAFVDERAPGRPTSRLAGSGLVSLGGVSRDGFAFHQFALASSDVALATVAVLAPSITLGGRLEMRGALDGPWRDATFVGTLRHVDGPGPATSLNGTARLTLGDTVALAADLVADSLSLDDLATSYPAIPLHGSLAGRVRVSGPITALAIDAALSGSGGGVRARGEVGVGDSVVRIRLGGSLDSLDLSGRLAGAPATRLTGDWRADLAISTADAPAATTGSVAVTLAASRVAGLELEHAGAAVAVTRERWEVDTAYAEQPGFGLVVSGALGRPGQPAGQLSFSLHADTLVKLESLVSWVRSEAGDVAPGRLDLRGGGRMRGRLVGTVDRWELQGDAAADDIVYRSLRAEGSHVSGSLARTARGISLALRATADTLAVAGMRYGDMLVTADGPLDGLRLHVNAGFALGSSLLAELVLRVDSSGWTARIEKGSLILPQRTWELAGTPRIAMTRDAVAIDSLELRAESGGRVRAAGRVPLEAPGDVTVTMDSVPLVDLYALAEADTSGIGGALSATLHLAGGADSPRIEGTASLAGGRFGDFRAPRVDLSATYDRKRLTFHAGLWRDRAQVVTASGSLPLDLALRSVERRQLPDSLGIRVRADSVDLAVVDALTSVVRDVGGTLTADVEVRGTWGQPDLQGSARISGGAASVPTLGARYTEVEARLVLAGDRLTVEEARLKGGAGTLGVTGAVRFEGLTRPVLDLALTTRGFSAFSQRDFAGLTASGDLRLTGPVLGATLAGRLQVDAGFLAFADLVEKRIVSLDDPEFRAVVDSNLARAADLGPSVQSVFLDSLSIRGLTVAMGSDVWLRSHEANIQLAGEFTVAKDVENGTSRYRLDGELRAVRGTYRLVVGPASKEFRVTRGTVRFFGTPDVNPVLDIAAEHTVRAVQGNDLVVRAVIGGTLLVPRLSLESDQRPPLSETEIVSYLLFGRPSFDLVSGGATGSRSEQAILQGALAGMAGVLTGELEQTLVADLGIPVDYIAIRPGGGGGTVGDIFGTTRVEAGTQIGERTFLTLNAGLCQVARGDPSQALGASVEYRLARRVSVEASLEPTVQECRVVGFQIRPPVPYQIGVDLFWQWGVP